ncbi:recombinase family protein [Aestuariibaculum sp. YM273]|uniref:recombinase family protein n=1 Tax=Aestuariibaculum sp. YM273 TaxID=3070659 RepID=UPI0027DAFF13|nr:recombinase family protein [Aestuariibaculum sp. YM273]WMI65522.1 recombinase family protein [Aestuariibaculum sp. YM273]
MKVKYVRVSSLEQNTARQEKNESEFDRVFVDKISGAISFFERPQGKKIVESVKQGKITEVHVSSIDRLGRDIIDVLTVCDFLTTNQINLFVENIGMYSLIDNKKNSAFTMVTSVLANVSSMERENMLERQRQGIEAAKLRGVYRGRLYGSRMTTEEFLNKYKKVATELKNGESLRRAAALGGVSLGVAQRVKQAMLEQN